MIFGNFGNVDSLGGILATIIQLLVLAIFFRAILSWVSPNPSNPIVQALDAVTEPILQPIRQIMPRLGGMDLSPMVAIIVLSVIASLVRQSGI